MSDRGFVGLFILAIILAVVLGLVNFTRWQDCSSHGGKYVKGVSLTGYVCVDKDNK